MQRLTFKLAELDRSRVSQAGGKGASLGELLKAGAPVPPGFVVSAEAFQAFARHDHWQAELEQTFDRLGARRMSTAEAAARIAAAARTLPVPDDVARAVRSAAAELGVARVSVRSSATCEDGATTAWAGQLTTYLDVAPDEVVERVRDCWLSLYGESALAYAAAHGYRPAQMAVAVVVQQMVDSEISGIAFSVHPVTQEPNILLIEACLGLGEAIVSGAIVPDQYLLERTRLAIIERAIGPQRRGLFREQGAPAATWRELGDSGQAPKMSDQQVLEYGRLLVRIADHYGFPVDTEWALAGGQFHVLQARPITTLAAEYREPIVDTSVDWQLLVRRPMTLLESSIWAHWMDSEHAAALPIVADRALSIQDDAGMANDFLSREAMDGGRDLLVELCRTDRGRVVELLKRGHAIYRDSLPRIERGAGGFATIAEACEFFVEAAQFTTIFPAWVLVAYEHVGLDDPEIRQLAEGLRAHTLYPSIERRIIDPLAEAAARAAGFSAPEEAPKVTTWGELRAGRLDREVLEARLEAVRSGRRFVFQSLDGNDQVRFVTQTGYLLMRLARQRKIVIADHPNELGGQPAWPGVYRGRARLVLSPDAEGQTLVDGEVLVSIQSSPALMPLLERCGAIVTDDGGIVCHAAILSRELRKPALIGTGRATSLIRTGDLVEVDTYAQVVRILERAGAKPAQK